MLENYLSLLDTKEILERYGVRRLSKNGKWWNGQCPFHHDINPSFGMHEELKIYNCFVCGGGDLLDFVSRVEGITRTQALEKILGIIPQKELNLGIDTERLRERIFRKISNLANVNGFLPEYDPTIIEEWRYIHPYMISRGFKDKRIYHHFRCGYSKFHERLTFPVFWGDRLVGVQGRRTDEQKPKYKPIPGYEFPASKVFYHFCPEYDRVLIVEGVFDCLRLWSYGILNVMASFGSHLSDTQIDILKNNFREIILWFDKDEAGEKGIRAALPKLIPELKVWVAEGIRNDPAEHSYEEVKKIKENLKTGIGWLMEKILRKGEFDAQYSGDD